MRVLLPPSEAKRPGGRPDAGRTDHSGRTGSAAALAQARRRVAASLVEFAVSPGASAALALPARSAAADLAANAAVHLAPRLPAIERYSGTVYEGLSVATLTRASRTKADAAVLIFSGLWGVLRADEPVPPYRLPASAALPGLGVLATFWRPVLDDVLPDLLGDGLVVDLRSTDYGAMWRPSGELRDRVVAVRVLTPFGSGPPKVISYPSKLGKGRLTRALVSRRGVVRTVGQVVDAWRAAGGSAGAQRTDGTLELIT